MGTVGLWWSCAVEAGRRIPAAFRGVEISRIGDLTVGAFLRASGPGGAVALLFLVAGAAVALWKLPRAREGGLTPGRTAFLAGLLAFLAGAIGTFGAFFASVYREKTAEATSPPAPIDATVAFVPALEGLLVLIVCIAAAILFARFRRSLAKGS